ncbi:acyl-ACP thioesterase domain-containing protein [Winogradskyella sp. 3972H.M.0a.05]|uniref:acyl-CoA thioesterase n=1 Tax=Winogradskyella sp. 3972H.M.0a.05 TaxID=2950277 RepID=UPI003397D509
MQVFEQELTVSQEDLDDLNHVNNVVYLQWVQDIAKTHWLKNANEALLRNYFWVVISHNIEYKSSALLHDKLLLKTYVSESKGVTSTRIVNIYNKQNNNLLVTCETKWCLMSIATKKPARITEEIATLFN